MTDLTPESPTTEAGSVADADQGNWVDLHAPKAWRPYLRLARADRPIGSWLLVFPCWWALVLALIAKGRSESLSFSTLSVSVWYLALFAVGAFVMRGAGCAYNDYVDRDYDAQVARTRSRPIPSGQVTPKAALAFIAALLLAGLAVLVQFNWFTIILGASSLALVAVYPFMKRLTYWPQVVLGLTFNWGALVGWAAIHAGLSVAPLLLYAGCVIWTIAYDTIYAHQDKEDDLALGLKSTAIRFGDETTKWLSGLYAATILVWLISAYLAGAAVFTFVALAAIGVHFIWQVATLDIADADNCLKRFKSNRNVGWMLVAGLLLDLAVVVF